ncbi:hypothetical protein F894_02093 [Acinetobacter sp. CIP 51.11]|uniref:hypothetical protein n=1 Tax=Acinetobacter sp. CIP 51.11 TaxID=1144670 RepID=UPI0002CD9256|nr:hypothetical protein [Acinetobacter sp. CIP 51.11]ENX13878.1 hypothetical protein F894_02093 [Acinetobacter sp. CIP 51.11]
MRKLKFMANTQSQTPWDGQETQEYVAHLLAEELGKYGFQTLSQSGAQVAVSVEEHALPLSVSCETRDEQGHLVCEIASYPEEEQDWLDRITERSLLNQLAQAVETSLKEQESFSEFEWKS